MIFCSDPLPQNEKLKTELDNCFRDFLIGGKYIRGPNCELFERRFANYIGVKYALGVANATDALEISLKALGIAEHDEVITTSLTAVATACAIKNVGACVIFADTEVGSYNICPTDVEQKITPKTKAIIAVHLHGQPCKIERLQDLCKKYNLFLVEDCSQAHGASVSNRKVGSFGDISCFSFYPTKNLAALGDGGAILTDKVSLLEKCTELHQYGWRDRISVSADGRNSRLDELQASFLNVKLNHLDEFNKERINIAKQYTKNLSGLNLNLPTDNSSGKSVYHQYVVGTPHRDKLKRYLENQEIFCGIHYKVPVHQQPNFFISNLKLQNTERQSNEILSLPMYPGLTETAVSSIIQHVIKGLK